MNYEGASYLDVTNLNEKNNTIRIKELDIYLLLLLIIRLINKNEIH